VCVCVCVCVCLCLFVCVLLFVCLSVCLYFAMAVCQYYGMCVLSRACLSGVSMQQGWKISVSHISHTIWSIPQDHSAIAVR
jgi:hypothetical protein